MHRELRVLTLFLAISTLLIPVFVFPGEATYEQAVARWPDQLRPIAFLGIKHHPDEFAVMWNGNISIKTTATRTDADRRIFGNRADDSLQVSFSVAGEKPSFENRYHEDQTTQASLVGGYLPIVQIKHENEDVVVVQEAFVTDAPARGTADWDAPVYLRIRYSVVEPGAGGDSIPIWAQFAADHTRYAMRTRRNVRISRVAPLYKKSLRPEGQTLVNSEGRVVLWASQPITFHSELPASESSIALRESQLDRNIAKFSLQRSKGATLELVFPFLPAASEELRSVTDLDYTAARDSIAQFWGGEVAQGMQVKLPEQVLNDLWRFNIVLSFIAADAYPNGDVVMKISPDHYEAYWPTPNAMQFQEMAQQGYLVEVAQYLEPFLDEERRRPVPNTGSSFASSDGFISGPEEHLAITWVSDHGAILWAASEYYLLSRDEQFLERWLPTLLKGVKWIAREREKTERKGGRDAGLMPAGRAMDAHMQGNFVWSDAWVYRGLDAVARLLREINHPEAEEWERERKDYRLAFNKALGLAVGRARRWTDALGNQVPFVPWELRQIGDTDLHPYYLDTGPLVLGPLGIVSARDETMDWALKWFTEGPDAGSWDPNWSDFAERSSLPFEMSSAEPCYSWNIYLRYLRDEREQFIEGFYSMTAGSVSRKFLGGIETRDGIQGLPVTNSVINNHLRNMLVFEDESEDGIHLLRNAPSAWFEQGKEILVERAQTYYGPLDLKIRTANGQLTAAIQVPSRKVPGWIRLHTPVPAGRAISEVRVNGSPVQPLEGGIVEINRPSGKIDVVVVY